MIEAEPGSADLVVNKPYLPDIILVVCDALGAKHMRLYGYHRETTPGLGKIISQAGFAVYERCFSASCWTPPATASLLTGLYPTHHGVNEASPALDVNVIFLPEIMAQLGYLTVGISCNGLVSRSTGFARGFEWFYELDRGFLISHADPEVRRLNSELRVAARSRREQAKVMLRWLSAGLNPARTAALRLMDYWYSHVWQSRVLLDATPYTWRAMKLARAVLKERRMRPVFLFLHLMQTHHNYNPPPETRGSWSSDESNHWRYGPDHSFWRHYAEHFNDEEIRYLEDLYDEEVLWLDRVLTKFIEEVLDSEQGRNTLLVITADHGEHFGEHGHMGHAFSLFNEVLWVPLLIRFPGGLGPSGQLRQLVQLTDVFATVGDLVQMPYLPPESSLSLLRTPERVQAEAEILQPEAWWSAIRRYLRKSGQARLPLTTHTKALITTTEENKIVKLLQGNTGKTQLYVTQDLQRPEKRVQAVSAP